MDSVQRTSEHSLTLSLTTHHVIKVVALLIMTIDHMGAYLYPDDLWWRAIGRVTFPVWFFLVGHALTYRTHRDTYLWAVVLLCLNPFLGNEMFPLNALVTILCCQLLLAQVQRRDWFTRCPWTLLVGCVALWFPSYLLMEYGSLGFLYALMGYAVRSGKIHTRAGHGVTILALLAFIGGMAMSFDFSTAQMLVAIAGTTLVTMVLVNFTHRPVTLAWMPNTVQRATLFLSRHSLQYYVVHRVILQAIGTAAGVLNAAFRWI
jgi:TraX protein